MLRRPDRDSDDGLYGVGGFIIESAKEMQIAARKWPKTSDLPSTHEHFIDHFTSTEGGREVTIIEIGVRRKGTGEAEPDGLNGLDDGDLSVKAAAAGVDPSLPKVQKVKAIREAKKEQVAA